MKEKKIKQEKVRKVFLDELPKDGRKYIDWKNSIGYNVNGICNDIKFSIKIIAYNKQEKRLTIEYNTNIFNIYISDFTRCKLGNLLGIKTSEFKIEIGTRFKDDNKDITIIARKKEQDKNGHMWKWYKYKCNKCGFNGEKHYSIKNKEYREDYWVVESDLDKYSCACCCNQPKIVIDGINSIWDTDKWMIPIINDDEFCKTHTYGCSDSIYPICTDCGRKKNKKIRICDIYSHHSINCNCGDGVSYPNKFAFSILEQLDIDFINEYSPDWMRPRIYDFYIPSLNIIIEMDGGLGHGKKDNKMSGQTKEESKAIDNEKDRLAKEHGIEVIRIDCNYKDNRRFEYIKNNVSISKKLNDLFDLSNIDWNKVEEYAISNLVKIVCEHKKNNPELTTAELAIIMDLSQVTIRRYLNKGTKLKWCYYNGKEEWKKLSINNGKSSRKPVEIFKDGTSLGIFESTMELERRSEDLFGVNLISSGISQVCTGKYNQYKGYTFKYVLAH